MYMKGECMKRREDKKARRQKGEKTKRRKRKNGIRTTTSPSPNVYMCMFNSRCLQTGIYIYYQKRPFV